MPYRLLKASGPTTEGEPLQTSTTLLPHYNHEDRPDTVYVALSSGFSCSTHHFLHFERPSPSSSEETSYPVPSYNLSWFSPCRCGFRGIRVPLHWLLNIVLRINISASYNSTTNYFHQRYFAMLSPHQVVVLHTVSVLWSRGKNIQTPRRIQKVVPLDRHLACSRSNSR